MAAGSIIIDLLMNTGSFETDTQRAQNAIKRMNKEFQDAKKGIDTLNGSFDSLTNTWRKLDSAQNGINQTMQKSQAGFRNANQVIQNTSYQITDFVVQVQGGVSAMRAFSQQAPQFLGAFGPIGAAAGVVAALAGAFIPLVVEAIKGGKALKSFDDAAKEAQQGMDSFNAEGIINSMKGIELEGRKAIATLYELKVAAMSEALKETQRGMTGIRFDVTLGDEGRIQSIAEKWKLSTQQANLYWEIATGGGQAATLINTLDINNKKHAELAVTLAEVQKQQQMVAQATKSSADVQKSAIEGVYDKVKTKVAKPDNTLQKMFENQRVGADKFIESMQRANEQVEFQSSLLGRSSTEVEVLNAQYRIQAELQKTIQDIERQNGTIREEELAKMQAAAEGAIAIQTAMITSRQQQERSFEYGLQSGLQNYVNNAGNLAKSMESAFGNAFSNMETGLTNFVLTGKASFTDFANALISDIMRIYIRMALTGLVGQFAGSLSVTPGQSSNPAYQGPPSAPVRGYADGGYTGDGGKYQPAGIVHAGEFVMSKEATSRIGVGSLNRMLKGYASGGYVGATPTGSGGDVSIVVNNNSSNAQATATSKTDSFGNRQIEIMVADMVNKAISTGKTDSAMRNAYNIRRSGK